MSQPIAETYVEIRARTGQFDRDLKAGVESSVSDVQKKLAQTDLFGKGVTAQVATLGETIKDLGLLTSGAGIESTRKNIKSLENAIGELQQMRAGASPSVAAQIDPQIAGLGTQLNEARTQFELLTQARQEDIKAAKQAASVQAQGSAETVRGTQRSLTSVRQLARSYGVVGIAATAGIQAARELSQVLSVTGQEAGTVEGRFRNLGSELLTGNIIGGLRALTAEGTLADKTLTELVTGSYRVAASFDAAGAAAQAEAAGMSALAKQLREVAAARAENQSRLATEFALRKENVTAQGTTLERGLSPDDRGGLRGPTAVRQINEDLKATAETRKQIAKAEAEAARESVLQNRVLRAQLTAKLSDDLAIARAQEAFYRRRLEIADKGSDEEKAALQGLTQAHSQVEGIEKRITDEQRRHREEQIAQLRERYDLAQTQLQIQEAQARTDSQETAALGRQADLARQIASDRRLDAQARADYALQAAQLDKQVFDIERQAAEDAKRLREQEAREAEQRRKEAERRLKEARDRARQTRELILENAISLAGLTKRTTDDKKAIKAQVAYYRGLVASSKGLEREQARAQLISARSRLQGLQKDKGTTGGATVAEFFQQAVRQFQEFGSNIGGRDSVLSGQDARGRFAGLALERAKPTIGGEIAGAIGRYAAPQLTETQKQTQILRRIEKGIRQFGVPDAVIDRETINRARSKAANLGGV